MRSTNFPPSVLAAILSACATESVNLNSERIEKRFGSYGIEVLASEAGLRRSSLFSDDNELATCRTYAVVQFVEQLDKRYNDAHSKVLEGNSIGATFREDGWDIRKKTLFVGSVRAPDFANEVTDLMHLSGSQDIALHVYQLMLARDDIELEYATILEAHHPDYLSEDNLRDTFDDPAAASLPSSELAQLSKLLFGPEKRN